MKKLLSKLLLLFASLVLLNNIFFYFIAPSSFCWANKNAEVKYQYLSKRGSEFNTIFVGTSKTYNQLDVAEFDSLTNHRTKSFNFGVEGIAAAEIFNFADNLISQDKNIRYAYIEVYDVDLMREENLNTCRVKYNYNFNVWSFNVNAIWHSNFGFRDKVRSTVLSSIALCEWILKFDLLKDVEGYYSAKYDDEALGKNKTGFQPLHSEGLTFDKLPDSRREYLLDTGTDRRLADETIRILDNYKSLRFDKAYYDKLKALVTHLKSEDVKVCLVLAPRINNAQCSNLLPVFMKIDFCDKINLADPQLNPEFYKPEYSFDARHLNMAGAEIYTRKVAAQFNRFGKGI